MQNNEAEKIELELPEGEVDLREADVDTSLKDEVVVEEQPVEQEAQPKDELDQISESVQKRIDKLTYKMREADYIRKSIERNLVRDSARIGIEPKFQSYAS